MATALELVKRACYQANLTAPTALVTATDSSVLQYLYLFYETGEQLRNMRIWPQLKKHYRFPLASQRQFYPLPQDFYCELPETNFDEANRWNNIGPTGDGYFNYRQYGYATIENRKAFRVFGPDTNPNSTRGQFQLNPVPGASYAGTYCSYEYLSRSWLMPPNWTPGTSYAANSYVNVNGNIYKTSAGGVAASTYVPTVAANGEGQDGGCYWTAIETVPAWQSNTGYAPQDYVTNGGNLYVCTTNGVSASSGGPTGTSSGAITDGTVSWSYCTIATWKAETAFAAGTFIKIGATYYKNTTPGIYANATAVTGKTQPNWTASTGVYSQSDGTVLWVYQPQAYEALVTDNDLCVFDDELMVLGLKWKFLQANRKEYEDFKADWDQRLDSAFGRLNNGRVFNMAGGSNVVGRQPIPEGSFYL